MNDGDRSTSTTWTRARAAGATILSEPVNKDHGDDWGTDRSYGALDCEGHQWYFAQRLVSPGQQR